MRSRPHSGTGWLLGSVLCFAVALGACASRETAQLTAPTGGATALTPVYETHLFVDQRGDVPLEPIDYTRVIVELVQDPSRPPAQIASDFDLVLMEQISAEYAVLQGPHDLAALRGDPDIVSAETNSLIESHGSDFVFGFYEGDWVDADGSAQTALGSLNLATLNQMGTGVGARVLVVDTGVDPEHPFLEPHLELLDPGTYLLGSVEPAPTGTGAAPAFGHGTHVAGCVLQVAPSATIIPARVLDHLGQGSLQDFVRGLAAALDPALDIDIVNLSMSTAMPLVLVHRMIDKLALRGVAVVAAAGNYDPENLPPPPSPLSVYAPVVGVVAVDAGDFLAPFSRFGSTVDLAAPGVSIQSCYPAVDGQPAGFTTASGTSFATPLVSGAIACIMQVGNINALAAVAQLRGDCVAVLPSNSVQEGRIKPVRTAQDLLPIGGGRVRR